VTSDLAIGSRVVSILDDAGLRVNVAMWLRTPEYEDWRFVLSSRELDAAGPFGSYRLVRDALDRGHFAFEDIPALLILKMTDPFVRALRRTFGKVKSVDGMRLGGQLMGDRFIEEAIVYRIR